MKAIRTILYPTDFSPSARVALDIAAMLARDQGARLLILHVAPSVPPATGPGDRATLRRAEILQEEVEAYREEMRRKLAQIATPYPGIPTERLLKEGDAARAILRTAAETPCDLIVMGAPVGSVAHEVTRQAHCPVVAVKVPSKGQ